jgi:hypothetical protein
VRKLDPSFVAIGALAAKDAEVKRSESEALDQKEPV